MIKWVHQLRAMLQKCVPLMNGKQLIACFILSYIFVIESMLVCTTNCMRTSPFIFGFSSVLLSCQETNQLFNSLSNSSCESFAK